ncbi:MAG TPA: hypothetical protein QF753_16725 [Victivallales bacterium]|nr:hypothetical protein [Victivallales bacterium]
MEKDEKRRNIQRDEKRRDLRNDEIEELKDLPSNLKDRQDVEESVDRMYHKKSQNKH